MAKKSKIEIVREYLSNERRQIILWIGDAIKVEEFLQADQLKEFRRILSVAIKLCGEEKPKEDNIE